MTGHPPVAARRSSPHRRIGGLVVLFWAVIVVLVGARAAFFDEIRVLPAASTASIGERAPG